MQRIDIDGVPVFTAPGPSRSTAALIFGVGIRDETYATLGITHLIEHLVMGTLPKTHLDSNAMVDVETTIFHATGKPDAVADFLARVCAAVSDVPTDRIELETGVLQAENCQGSHPTAATLWAARFRLTGPGLAIAGGGVPEGVTPEMVREHAARWFVRSNAALVWHGDLPHDGLRLTLPDGPMPEHARVPARPQPGPVWMQGPTAGVGLLLTCTDPANVAFRVAVDVLLERMRDVARHERGVSYSADVEIVDVAPDHRELAVLVDAREGREAEVARVLWDQFLDIGKRGPTAAEIEHSLAGFTEHLDTGDEAAFAELMKAGFSSVFGLPHRSAADMLADWRAVTAEAAAEALSECRPTAVLVVPGGVDPNTIHGGITRSSLCNQVPELPSGTAFRPSSLRRLFSKEARMTLVVGTEGLAHEDADGERHLLPWSEVEALLPALEGAGVAVVGRNLCLIEVHEKVYGRRAVEAVRARVPDTVWIPAPRASEENARI